MNRFYAATVASTSYPGAAQVDFTLASGTPPSRLCLYNDGVIGVRVSVDGSADHDYIPPASGPVYRNPMNQGPTKLWFKLEAAGSCGVRVVDY